MPSAGTQDAIPRNGGSFFRREQAAGEAWAEVFQPNCWKLTRGTRSHFIEALNRCLIMPTARCGHRVLPRHCRLIPGLFMTEIEAERFLEKAEDCLHQAATAVSQLDAESWLLMAREWTRLANDAEQTHNLCFITLTPPAIQTTPMR